MNQQHSTTFGLVIVHPRAFKATKRPPDDYQDRLVELMDLVSKHDFGCPSALLPTAQHQVLLDTIEGYLTKRAAMPTVRAS
jgi:hypothetical protein